MENIMDYNNGNVFYILIKKLMVICIYVLYVNF